MVVPKLPVRVMIPPLLSLVSEVGGESSAGSVSFGCMSGRLCVSNEMFGSRMSAGIDLLY